MINQDENRIALNLDQVSQKLDEIGYWDYDMSANAISRSFSFSNFEQAMNFANRVAQCAEELNHHPKIIITYNTVKLELFTHDVSGLTNLDFTLAQNINQIEGVGE